MAKRYTRAQWEELQASFPEEDRTPYELSPDLPSAAPTNQYQPGLPPVEDEAAPDPTPKKPQGVAGANWIQTPGGGFELQVQGRPVEDWNKQVQTGQLKVEDDKVVPVAQVLPTLPPVPDKPERSTSAYDYLIAELNSVGLETLAKAIENMLVDGTPPSSIPGLLRKLPEYVKRFPANEARLKAGLRVLSPAEYIDLEQSYQEIMQNYGLPESYYTRQDNLSSQPIFDKLISAGVDSVTLEKKLIQGVNEIMNKPQEYLDAFQRYYPEAGIGRGDLLAYVVDPKNALNTIKTKVSAAQIGGEYLRAGAGTPGGIMSPSAMRAEELARAGVTAEAAREVAGVIPESRRGTFLSRLQGAPEYGQAQVEEELFQLGGAQEARKQRKDIGAKERALYQGSPGISGGALSRDRAGAI